MERNCDPSKKLADPSHHESKRYSPNGGHMCSTKKGNA